MSTFVSVGNATQPFSRLLNAVANLAAQLPQPVFVQYGSNTFRCDACQATAFLDMESFTARLCSAELVIVHAGAGSVIQAVQAGKVPVVAPRRRSYGEVIDDHQVEFARALAEAQKVVLLEDLATLRAAVDEARLRQARRSFSEERPALVANVEALLSQYARNSHA
jgi:UDP-N-acetylglucosamine transferase subunit ALG13